MAGGPYQRYAPSQQLPRFQPQPPPQQYSTSRILLWALTMLPLGLAAFAFGLQWKGGALSDPATIGRLGGDNSRLPGVQLSNSPSGGRTVTTTDCTSSKTDALTKRNIASFPHHPGWQYVTVGDSRPKVELLAFLSIYVLISAVSTTFLISRVCRLLVF